jgi:hypothetical protein
MSACAAMSLLGEEPIVAMSLLGEEPMVKRG